MSSVIGQNIKYSLFGESHGKCIGMTIHGYPEGVKIDTTALNLALEKRKTGGEFTSKRIEPDVVEFISGVLNHVTTGAPLTFILANKSQKTEDYESIGVKFRPSHADYTAHVKYDGFNDKRGGGIFSGRLTACYVVAGALCMQILATKGIIIESSIVKLGNLLFPFSAYQDQTKAWIKGLDKADAKQVHDYLSHMTKDGDSVGGDVRVVINGLNAGLGNPHFRSVESVLSAYYFSVPGVKAVGFGLGTTFSDKKGSEVSDNMRYVDGKIVHQHNYNGGVIGGITNGEEVVARLTFKPTASIFKPLETINIKTKQNDVLQIVGRHDPAFVLRTPIVVTSVTAMAVLDMLGD